MTVHELSEGGERSGDEEKASREEGCPKEKEVDRIQAITLGAAPPSGTHTLYFIHTRRVNRRLFICSRF
jgi:hypothetical protein